FGALVGKNLLRVGRKGEPARLGKRSIIFIFQVIEAHRRRPVEMTDRMIARRKDAHRRAPARTAMLLEPDFVGWHLLHFRHDCVPHRDLMLSNIKELGVELGRPFAFGETAEETRGAHPRWPPRRRRKRESWIA